MDKVNSAELKKLLQAVYSKVTGFDAAQEVLTVLKQVEAGVIEQGKQVVTLSAENKNRRLSEDALTTQLTTAAEANATLTTDLATANKTISESDPVGLQATITALQEKEVTWTKERSDRAKIRLETIAKHPSFKALQEKGLFKGITVKDDKVEFAEDLKPENILEMGVKAEEYTGLGIFGQVTKLDTPQDRRLNPTGKEVEVVDRSTLAEKLSTGLKEYP